MMFADTWMPHPHATQRRANAATGRLA